MPGATFFKVVLNLTFRIAHPSNGMWLLPMLRKFLPNCAKAILFALGVFLFLPSRAQYTIHNVYGDLATCDTMTRGIFIVWWDSSYNYASQVNVLLDSMMAYRNDCLSNLGMEDPPNPQNGYYYNVYIHTPGDTSDFFYPYNWANGQGTDQNGYPFLTLPNGVLQDWINNSHETFHIFQYSGNSPGYAYSGSSQWYIEASANWFAARHNPHALRTFVEGESLVRLPQVPLWLSYDNFPADYPANWQRYVHQYALSSLLYYLTQEANVPDSLISAGFYNQTTDLPQAFFYHQLGGNGQVFRNDFLNWTAHMVNNFDFIDSAQVATNINEWNNYADPSAMSQFTRTFDNTGSNGWFQPNDTLITTAWSFNTYRLINTEVSAYTFELNGNTTGNQGTPAYFNGELVVENDTSGASFYHLNMDNNFNGSLTLNLNPSDTAVYFIVASMPEYFADNGSDFQLFPYQMRISAVSTGLAEIPTRPKKLIARYNLLGQPVKDDYRGIQLWKYNDGSVEKKCVLSTR